MFCYISGNDGFVCPGADGPYCTVYSNRGVKAANRRHFCSFKDVRRPPKVALKSRINPLKASKRRVKSGSMAD
jgi:hypothetical protein